MKQVSSIVLALLGFAALAPAALINGDFSNPLIGSTPFRQEFSAGLIYSYNQADVPGWDTTDVNGAIEIWRDGAQGFRGFNNLPQWAELNAYSAGTLSQVVSGLTANSTFGFSFAHRGRGSATIADVMQARFYDLGADNAVGGGNDTLIYSANFSATNVAWVFHQINFGVKPNNNNILVQFEAISTGSGNPTVGNFLTAVSLDNTFNSITPTAGIPEPSTFALLAGALVTLAYKRRN
jgi:hypothetical protein